MSNNTLQENNELSAEYKNAREKLWLLIKPRIPIAIIWACWGVICLRIAYQTFCQILTILYLDLGFLDGKVSNIMFWFMFPIVLWLIETCNKYFNYEGRKVATITIAVINSILLLWQIFTTLSLVLVVPIVMMLPTNKDITPVMVINLARLISVIIGVVPSIAASVAILRIILNQDMRPALIAFKLNRGWDFRSGKRYLYDITAVRRKKDGRPQVVRQGDRTLHELVDGASGGGKTSSVFTVQICDDLDKKAKNEDLLKKYFVKLIKRKDLKLNKELEDIDFSVFHFEALTDKGKKKYNKLCKKIKSCGITTMAPNASFADEVYELCVKRNIKVNRIDPVLINGTHKPGYTGYNPLYISPKKQGVDRDVEIAFKAGSFADVLQAIYDMSGKGDPYFTSLNRNITNSVIQLLLVTFESINHRQPNPRDFQNILNDFALVTPYVELLKNVIKNEPKKELLYRAVIDSIELNLLGENAKEMNKQATGLRNQVNELLSNPLISDVLCADEVLDMDEALENGEVTVVNYALELGQATATAFGLFFALNFIGAVLRRPGTSKTRLPHFWYIDEFPLLLHPRFETAFSLFRQYNCCLSVAIQSLDQFAKNEQTKYMKNVVLTNTATQIYFGRGSVDEMEMLVKIGGKHLKQTETRSTSEQALSVENTSLTYGTRYTNSMENLYEGTDVRYKDFQEVTMITVENGTPLLPFAGTVDFLEKHRSKEVRRRHVNWSDYYAGIASEAADFDFDFEVESNVNVKEEHEVENKDEFHINIEETPSAAVETVQPEVENNPTQEPSDNNSEEALYTLLDEGKEEKEEPKQEESADDAYDAGMRLDEFYDMGNM